MPRTNITIESEHEDIYISIRQSGKRIVFTTERPGIAKSIYRKLVTDLTEETASTIGFDTTKQE